MCLPATAMTDHVVVCCVCQVSIEMIEAVGHEHLPSYFTTINAALKPGGKAVIQVRVCPGSLRCVCEAQASATTVRHFGKLCCSGVFGAL